MSILENIHGHQDLCSLDSLQREILCQEIREFLVDRVSKTGGHVASNLGVVELSVAIETVFDTAKDRLVFDVGHQSYVHKLLTGRQAAFHSLRQYGGIAGFPKPSESDTDAFTAGHASSSVSIALGMARARTMQKKEYQVIALLGDGAATGGLAYEGFNDAAVSGEPMIIILNDNALSIDRNVGAMASHLRKLRTKEQYLGMKRRYRTVMQKLPGGKWIYRVTHKMKDRLRRILIPTTIFENMGFTYLGPVNGHDTEKLIYLLKLAGDMERPVVLHVMTKKGKGYKPSEEHPKLFHGVGKFDPETGEPFVNAVDTFSDGFGRTMVCLSRMDSRVCAITAAMPGGTGLLDYKKEFPKRLFDVGIAEGHAVSMAGGLAKQGMIPVVALYSTFLQRSYDMILHDICLQQLHVVLAVDRAGLVGEDGETHHGVFDVGFLRHAPGMTVLCPASIAEQERILHWAIEECTGPVAVRYPRGGNRGYTENAWQDLPNITSNGLCVRHSAGKDAAIITYGTLLQNAMDAAEILLNAGIDVSVLRLLTVSPLPVDQLADWLDGIKNVVILEETQQSCGIGAPLGSLLMQRLPDIKMDCIDLCDSFVPHGTVGQLYKQYGMDADSIADHIQEVLRNEK